MAYWFSTKPAVSRARVNSHPRYIFGHQAEVQPHLRKATEGRAVIRFVGPSGWPKDDKTAYFSRVSEILDVLRDGLTPVKEKIEINTGVSAVGLDLVLSQKFYGVFPASGVVSWLLPKVTCRYQGGASEVVTLGPNWELGKQKEKQVKWFFEMAALLVHGEIPQQGITIPTHHCLGFGNREGRNEQGRVLEELVVQPEEVLPMTPLDHATFYGPTWGEAYDINRATLQAVVVLGGGLISREEAIAAKQNRIPVFCIVPEILPEKHNLGKPSEMDSASTYLVQTHKFPAFTPEQIVDGIKRQVLGIKRRPGMITISYPEI
jgi:hypothetical protein